MTIFYKATEEEDRNVYNKYICYKLDALWLYWHSIGTFAIHVAICCKNCKKNQILSKGVRKV